MLLGFHRRFAPLIESGQKTHTIRGYRKISPRVGEICHCYVDPRQKSMRLLGRWPCVQIEGIEISARQELTINGVVIGGQLRDRFAQRDGFDSFAEMMVYWRAQLPFDGQIIHWDFAGRVDR